MALKTALYHNDNGVNPRQLFVLKENLDGTVDLGSDENTPVVTKCPLSDVPKPGYATFEDGKKAPEKTAVKTTVKA